MPDFTELLGWLLPALSLVSSVFVFLMGRAILGHCQRLELSQRSAIGWSLVLCGALTITDISLGRAEIISTAIITVIAVGCLVVYRLNPDRQVQVLTDMGVLDDRPHHPAG